MRFLQSVPFRGLLHTASVPESRRVSQWIDCQNGEKARQKAGPEARPSRNTNREYRENIEPAERRRDQYITQRITAVRHGRSATDQSITTQRPTLRGKYEATKFENNSKIFRN